MTQLREQVHVEITGPADKYRVNRREWWPGAIGILAAATGVYMRSAPDTWLFGGLGEGWYLGAFALAGLFLAASFAWLARRSFLEDDGYSPTVLTGIVLALVSLTCAVVFLITWIV